MLQLASNLIPDFRQKLEWLEGTTRGGEVLVVTTRHTIKFFPRVSRRTKELREKKKTPEEQPASLASFPLGVSERSAVD